LARFFAGLFGTKAESKRLPHWMLELPTEKQRALLCGLWRGDGYINQHTAKYVTISRQLAHQVKALLLRQRIIFSFLTVPRKGIHKESYCIYVKDDQSLSKLGRILGIRVDNPPKKRNHHKSWFDGNYFYLPVRRIETLPYKGVVHNLEVAGSHSFVSDSLCLHNCGDLTWIFIKVKDNRLEDVKFKTFGCGAAIATSSMVTEMAKGKTLEEAMKITRNDVADELGGLPPIKMHCSNLAADGLHLAIEDYLKKKGLPVPKAEGITEEKREGGRD
jgi:nitrogen fixation NifU-like protein